MKLEALRHTLITRATYCQRTRDTEESISILYQCTKMIKKLINLGYSTKSKDIFVSVQ